MVAIALSVAGLDPSGGAGIAADLKTFHQHGVYGCAVASLITVQNTQRLSRVEPLPAQLVEEQLAAVLEDFTPNAAKTGALGSVAIVEVVARSFARARVPLVIDPVRVAKHDAALLADEARDVLLEKLMPVATLITANADEAAWLSGHEVRDLEDALKAAETLRARGPAAVMIKGGHLSGSDATDLLLDAQGVLKLSAPRIAARHTHGVGCTLSAAITANLALGMDLRAACERAKAWVSAAIASAPGVGQGIGAVDHLAAVPFMKPPGD